MPTTNQSFQPINKLTFTGTTKNRKKKLFNRTVPFEPHTVYCSFK